MIKNIEYRCDDCSTRLFDLVSDAQEIEIKYPKCKESVRLDIKELHRFLHIYNNLKLNKVTKINRIFSFIDFGFFEGSEHGTYSKQNL